MKALNGSITRRRFLQQSATISGGLMLGVSLNAMSDRQAEATGMVNESGIGFFVRIEPDGRVIIGSPQPEMGQGVKTSLPMLIAEELDVDWSSVAVEQMPLGLTRDAEGNLAWLHVGQGAGGSTSVSDSWQPLREAGATARLMLMQAAAQRWQLPVAELTTEPGVVVHAGSNRRLNYGELAVEAAKLTLPETAPALKSREQFRIIGHPTKVVDGRDIVMGTAMYGIDAELPGQVYAVMERCPWHDGTLKSLDDTEAKKVPGVLDVLPLKGPEPGEPYTMLASGVAVTATSTWAAMQGRRALKITWNKGPHAYESTASLRQQMEQAMRGAGQVVMSDGDLTAAMEDAAETLESEYFVPYVSHAPMEPQCCVVHIREDGADVIGPMQMPNGATRMVTKLTGLDRLSINVEMTRLGGGFGRRLSVDYVAEATLISMEVKKPVKLQWSREDDLQHDFYRPCGLHQMRAGLTKDNKIIAWQQRLASPSKYYRRANVAENGQWEAELYSDDLPRQLVPNIQLEYFSMKSGAPRGSWRAPAHTANAFVVQSFIDELAAKSGVDPLQYQLKLLGEGKEYAYSNHGGPTIHTGRLAEVLKKAASEAGWGEQLPKGWGRGIAGHFTFGSYTAYVVDVSVDDSGLRVQRVVGAVDCGLAVNPNHVIAQMEGGVLDGLSTALRLEITLSDGRVQQSNFHDYPLASMADAPREVAIHIMDSSYPPTGMGEPPISPLAPALTNAIFAATGKRIRELPIGNQVVELH